MVTKHSENEILLTTSQPSQSQKIKRFGLFLIIFTIIILYIFSDELSSIFTDVVSCNKETCLKFNDIKNETEKKIDSPIIIESKPIDSEKFLTYVPHSGLHNQRIAFEHAVFLAWSLNRTLILPPVLLGKRFGYTDYDTMLNRLLPLKTNKSNVEKDCVNEVKDRPEESTQDCIEFHKSYMLTTWNHLFNLSFIEKHVKIIYNHRVNIPKLVHNQLKIKDEEKDVYYDKLYPGYHNFFESSIPPEKIQPIADGRIKKFYILSQFKHQPQKLLVFASLFGPGTFIRQSEKSEDFFHDIRNSILPKNEIMLKVAKKIADRMGGTFNYLTFHGRAGDGTYKLLADERIAGVINNLKRDMPDFNKINMTLYNNLTDSERHKLCFKNIKLDPKAKKFSRLTRIYVASDVPKSSPPLQVIFQTFPCAYMMSDFEEEIEPLNQVINNVDKQSMYKFILPLVDLMVGSNAKTLYTMGRSTFASYMLRYHYHLLAESKKKLK
ncbi:hypothetical protein RclHR1_04990014 [Rhizophagus clarus]|uniref:CigA protein n=1 Tax=Rhizophagus clarus TaxID=94130 RepID=A0A2Z6RLP2_9GLOM|nr:hypothetical protein RclHR1_04990014 [Rhizophagus clarus]GET00853.1 CigA protein [Rhizophagus clarus]